MESSPMSHSEMCPDNMPFPMSRKDDMYVIKSIISNIKEAE